MSFHWKTIFVGSLHAALLCSIFNRRSLFNMYCCPCVGLNCGSWVRPPPSVKICVSVCWVTLWVRPPLCVSVQLVTLWVRPPLVCVLSLEDNLHCHWILACCLLRFAAFLVKWLVKKEFGVDKNSRSVNKFCVNDKVWIPVWKKFWVWKRFLDPKQSLGPKKFWAPNYS